jgi:drug/metabolite transporter (DMT)-like permease
MTTISPSKKDNYLGMLFAVVAVIIWSGNFIIARAVNQQIGPVSLAFFRWFTATLIIAPLAWKKIRVEKAIAITNWKYIFWTSITGITLFNTLVYVSGHYTTAINMALIGTTSSPVFAIILAVIFLKEKLTPLRLLGMLTCISGILLLLSKGSWYILAKFRFSTGDLWILAAALAFGIYSMLVKKKPSGLSPLFFLFVLFAAGTLMLFPFFLVDFFTGNPIQWSYRLLGSIIYLGAGTSVIAFLCWNLAIQKLGTSGTVLFGNLIPVFSAMEAVWLLDETVSRIQLVSGLIVIIGLLLANSQFKQKSLQ